jgi:hypothetical protein
MTRIIDGKDIGFNVPSANAAGNNSMIDVIGNKSDDEAGNSLYAKAFTMEKHMHGRSKVFPTLAAGIRCTAAATAFKLGQQATIWASAGIATGEKVDVHFLVIASLATVGLYELVLYESSGATAAGQATEIGRTKFIADAAKDVAVMIPVMTPLFPSSRALRAKLAYSGGTAHTADISVMYHTY